MYIYKNFKAIVCIHTYSFLLEAIVNYKTNLYTHTYTKLFDCLILLQYRIPVTYIHSLS